MEDSLFSVPMFFILFRETLEAAVIVSVLLAFLRQTAASGNSIDETVHRRLRRQVWLGTGLGLLISVAIGSVFIGLFYVLKSNVWENHDVLWEGILGLISAVFITVMGLAMLKTNRMHEKWKSKLSTAMKDVHANEYENEYGRKQEDSTADAAVANIGRRERFMQRAKEFGKKHGLFLLPFLTVLREGVEAVVFMGGASATESAKSIPIAAASGVSAGLLVGYLMYRGNKHLNLKYFFIVSTCILLLMAAGLFAGSIFRFEQYTWNSRVSEFLGATAEEEEEEGGLKLSVDGLLWYTSWGDFKDRSDPVWSILNALVGWNNHGTVGTVTGYCLYWFAVAIAVCVTRYRDTQKLRRNIELEDGKGSATAVNCEVLDLETL